MVTWLPIDLVPSEGWGMQTEITKWGSSSWGNAVVQFLQGGESGGDVATAVT